LVLSTREEEKNEVKAKEDKIKELEKKNQELEDESLSFQIQLEEFQREESKSSYANLLGNRSSPLS